MTHIPKALEGLKEPLRGRGAAPEISSSRELPLPLGLEAPKCEGCRVQEHSGACHCPGLMLQFKELTGTLQKAARGQALEAKAICHCWNQSPTLPSLPPGSVAVGHFHCHPLCHCWGREEYERPGVVLRLNSKVTSTLPHTVYLAVLAFLDPSFTFLFFSPHRISSIGTHGASSLCQK